MRAITVFEKPKVVLTAVFMLISVPAAAASNAPNPKVKARIILVFTPISPAVPGSSAVALIALPMRERLKKR